MQVLITCLVRLCGFIRHQHSVVNNRAVFYNYLDSTSKRPVWLYKQHFSLEAIGKILLFLVYHMAQNIMLIHDTSFDVVGNTDGVTIYYEHETGLIN